MKKLNIVYLHGFGSSGQSDKVTALKKHYNSPEFNVISPTLPVNSKDAIKEITKILSTNDNFILIGTSLGGFYADYFNKLADIPCVLINPAINVKLLAKYIGINKNYNTGKEYTYSKKDFDDLVELSEKKDQFGYNESPEYVIVAKDDELCDWRLATKTFNKPTHWLQIEETGGHRFNNIKLILETLDELIYDLGGYNFSKMYNESYQSKKIVHKDNALNERYLNLFKLSEKERYFDEIAQYIQETYEYIGGFAGNIHDFLNDNYFWKLIRKNGYIVAGIIYKEKLGRKSICAFTNGMYNGKVALKILLKDDLKRAWVEVSGKAENVYKYSLKETPLPHEIVKIIMNSLGKEVIEWDEDGYHYTRLINNKPYRKAIYGKIQK